MKNADPNPAVEKDASPAGSRLSLQRWRAQSPMSSALAIRDIRPIEFDALGKLMVEVYSSLEGFPTPAEQPHYYDLLANIGRFTEKRSARVLVAVSSEGELVGGIVYFGDMAEYGSGGIAASVKDASGIRLRASVLIIATSVRVWRWPTHAFS